LCLIYHLLFSHIDSLFTHSLYLIVFNRNHTLWTSLSEDSLCLNSIYYKPARFHHSEPSSVSCQITQKYLFLFCYSWQSTLRQMMQWSERSVLITLSYEISSDWRCGCDPNWELEFWHSPFTQNSLYIMHGQDP
jgi:hypothetical protein